LSGILTDRDIVVRCVAGDFDPSQVPVGALCTADVVALPPEAVDGDAVRVMVDRAVRRVPIVEQDQIVGIVSLGDLAVARDATSALGRISAAPPTDPS
jgi:CBS domain-containing protein